MGEEKVRSLSSQNALSCPSLCCEHRGSDQALSPGQRSALSWHFARPAWNILWGVYFLFYTVRSFPRRYLQPTRSQSGTEAGILELKWEDKRTSLFSLTIGWNSVFPSILNEGNQQGNSRWYTQCISLLCIRWLLIKDSQIFSYHIIVVAAILKYLCSSLLQNLMVVSSLARICYFIF